MDSTEIIATLKARRDEWTDHLDAAQRAEVRAQQTAELAEAHLEEIDAALALYDDVTAARTGIVSNDPRLDPEPQRAVKRDVQALVVHLAMRDGGATAEEIIGGIARKRSQVNAAINGAMKKGKIVFRDGTYQVPESGASLPLESAAE